MCKAFIGATLLVLPLLGSGSHEPTPAAAELRCTCIVPDSIARLSEQERVRLAVDEADAVFLGRVISGSVIRMTDPDIPPMFSRMVEYEFEVMQIWKGALSDTVRVRTGLDEGMCGVELAPYQAAVVYAGYPKIGNQLGTSICDRTARVVLLDQRDPEIRLLNNLVP